MLFVNYLSNENFKCLVDSNFIIHINLNSFSVSILLLFWFTPVIEYGASRLVHTCCTIFLDYLTQVDFKDCVGCDIKINGLRTNQATTI